MYSSSSTNDGIIRIIDNFLGKHLHTLLSVHLFGDEGITTVTTWKNCLVKLFVHKLNAK